MEIALYIKERLLTKNKICEVKIMKNLHLFVLIFLLLVISVFTVGYSQEITLRYSGGFPQAHPVSDAQVYFAEELNKRTNGKVEVDVFFGSELYTYAGAIDAASAGALDLGYSNISHWSSKNEVFDFSSYFFQIKDLQQMAQIADEVIKIVGPLFEQQGVKLLHIFYLGECGIATRKPIRELEDMKGMIIRSTSPPMIKSLEALGATPATIASAEQYDAISRGVIDGDGTGYSTMVSRKIYEITDYIAGPFWNPIWVAFMSLDTWNSLPEDVKKLIEEVSKDTQQKSFEIVSKADQEAIEFLKGQVKEFIYFTPEEREKWAAPVKPIFQEWVNNCEKAGYGDEARKLLDLVS